MEGLYEELLFLLQEENKEKALKICMKALEDKNVSIVDLYQNILSPALNHIIEEYPNDEDLIWREHVRSGIIRNIVEAAYPYVLEERDSFGEVNKGNVIVMCPEYEDHDLGARMVSDFFTIVGYNTTFIGAKTPRNTILKAVEIVSPKYLCISVTNYYNLISVKKTIESIKTSTDESITFLLGGSAFISNPNAYKEVGGDYLLNSFQDIKDLSKGVE
ncbi:MAG: cobalamin-dependent protein [Tissierellaceae bacterium]|nr:cobalamin-dependent protein [Tissierellaceae bacterium]